MADQRKRIIIAEIENWRKNNLLPEHYCIFLLNLYSEGEHRPAPAGGKRKQKSIFGSFAASAVGTETGSGPAVLSSSSGGGRSGLAGGVGASHSSGGFGSSDGSVGFGHGRGSGDATIAVSWKMVLSWFFGACLIAATILLAFHFNDFSVLMQIAITTGFTVFFYILALLFRRSIPMLTHVCLMLSFLILIGSGIYLLSELSYARSVLLLFLVLVCLLWCLNGILFQFNYLLYCGILGLGLLYGVGTVERIALEYSWWKVELYWVPLALLMIGLGFLLQMREHRLAGVFAICGMLFFFGSEIQSLYIPKAEHDIIQLWLFIKVFLSSGLFFFTRTHWFRWLRL